MHAVADLLHGHFRQLGAALKEVSSLPDNSTSTSYVAQRPADYQRLVVKFYLAGKAELELLSWSFSFIGRKEGGRSRSVVLD